MKNKLDFHRNDFPADFLFGTATSSYQIEGSSHGKAGSSHWDSFAARPGNILDGSNGGIACDHYRKFPEDLDLAANAGFDAYRFSFSWPRVMPDGKHKNEQGFNFNDRLIDSMLERNLKPFATLYHWDLPSALSDTGGWCNRETALLFAEYADIMANRFGDRIHSVATINEPWCVSWLSHFEGLHAPGLRDIRAAARSMHHVLLAHGLAIDALRTAGQKNLGIVLNFEHVESSDEQPHSMKAASLYDSIYNRWFIEGIIRGQYPEDIVEELLPHLPNDWESDMATISQKLDWLGINYYTRKIITQNDNAAFGDFTAIEGPLPKTTMGWEVYPDGLLYFLKRVAEITGELPLYITENGMSAEDDQTREGINDFDRIDFFNQHFAKVREALTLNIPLKGYFVWSLLDNFEWALGFTKRFGLVHVDYNSLKRTPKASYHAFKSALK